MQHVLHRCTHESPWFRAFPGSGTTDLRTGSLSCIDVLYFSPGAPPEFSPSWLSPASTSPLRDMVLKNLFGVVEGWRSFFCNFFQLRLRSRPAYQEPRNSPYSIQRLKRTSWGHHRRCVLVGFNITLGNWLGTLEFINLMCNFLSLEDTSLTSKLNKQGPKSNRNSNVIKGPRRGNSHVKVGSQEVRVSLIPWPYWLYLCSLSSCS